jgi:hypothetical protein
MVPLRATALSVAALLLIGFIARAEVIPYPPYPGAPKSTLCSLSVDGASVFVHQYNEKSYAHFAFTGEVTVRISSMSTLSSFLIQPRPYGIVATKDGNSITFKLNQPRKLVINFNASVYTHTSPALFLFAEAPETNPPRIGDANVKNIMDYGADNTGITSATAKITQAMTEAAALQNGVVFFPGPAIYKVESVAMRSNVTLYVQAGAQIKGTGNFSYSSLRNVRVRGRGCIDMPRGHRFTKCQRIDLEGVFIRTCDHWTIYPTECDSMSFTNIKILNHSLATGGYTDDAIDFDNSRHMLVDDVFAFEVDDFVGLTGVREAVPTPIEDITVRNCVAANEFRFLLIKGQAVEGHYKYCKNVLIENSHHITDPHGGGPLFFLLDGSPMDATTPLSTEDVRILNCSTTDGQVFGCVTQPNYTVRNIYVEDFTCYASGPSFNPFTWMAWIYKQGGIMENISFKCWTIAGQTITGSAADTAKFHLNIQVPVTYLPCDGVKVHPRRTEGNLQPSPFGLSSWGQALRIGSPGDYRLVILRPDGRTIAGSA